jgi:hypothetical protein
VTARKWFAISAFLMLVFVAVVTVNSYNQEWKQYQRAYLNEQLTKKFATENQRDPNWFEQLNIGMNSELNLQVKKVVTETGRSADLCMSCHIDVEKLIGQHNKVNFVHETAQLEALVAEIKKKLAAAKDNEEEVERLTKELEDPERELNKYINRQFAFDSFGCTACHGGDNLGLTLRAHNEMRLDFKNIFEENLERLESPQWTVRQLGIERIRWMTGQDFGFSFSAPEAARHEATERAKDWWNLHKDTFLAEKFGERSSPFKTENLMAEKLAQRPDIAFTAEPLEYVGSATCLACHATPSISENYIPDSHKTHVERWFRDAYMSSKNQDIYKSHPYIDQELLKTMDVTCEACHGPGSEYVKLMQKGLALDIKSTAYDKNKKEIEAQIEILTKKLETAKATGNQSEVQSLGKEIVKLKEEASRLGGDSSADATRASELLAKAKEIARCNARHSISDSRVWAMLERLLERADPSARAGTGPEPDPKVAANVRCE